MVFLHIDQDGGGGGTSSHLLNQLNHHLAKKKGATFILFYMEGCGPCNATRPEWKKLEQNERISKIPDLAIVSMNHVLANKLHGVEEPNSFPTIRYMKNGVVENYEDSEIPVTKDRSIDSFVEWIESKTNSENIKNNENIKKQDNLKNKENIKKQDNLMKTNHDNKNKTENTSKQEKHERSKTSKRQKNNKTQKKNQSGGRKWSRKYKKSINCRRPRGFSQHQYCKYGRKK
jgi:hypothetical protein